MRDIEWRPEDTDGLVAVLRTGDARSLRFLDVTGVLDRALPEVGEALARRRADPGELDPTRVLQLPTVQRIADARRSHDAAQRPRRRRVCRPVGLGVLTPSPPGSTRTGTSRIVDAVHGATLLDGALANPDSLGEASILQLAEHFGGAAAVDAAHELAAARLDDDDWQRKELDEIRDRLLTALSYPELLDGATTVVDARRRAAMQTLAPESTVASATPREGFADVPRVPRPGGARSSGVAGRRAATSGRRARVGRRRARRTRDVSHRCVVPRSPRSARPAHRRDRRRRPRCRRRLADDVAGRGGARLVRRAQRHTVPTPAG